MKLTEQTVDSALVASDQVHDAPSPGRYVLDVEAFWDIDHERHGDTSQAFLIERRPWPMAHPRVLPS